MGLEINFTWVKIKSVFNRKINKYKHNEKHGRWVEYRGDYKSDGIYVNGLKQGKWIEFGTKGSYKNGLKEGLWISYQDKDVLEESNYINDKLNGASIIYNSDGEIYKLRTYKDGVLHGLYEKYITNPYRNGGYNIGKHPLVSEIGYYENGELNGIRTEYEYLLQNVRIKKRVIPFKDGKIHGDYKLYYGDHNNNLGLKINFINGKRHGYAFTYYGNGELSKEEYYNKGVLTGLCREYSRWKYLQEGNKYYFKF